MAATEPIRNKHELRALADYFLQKGQLRNYVMVIMGASTVLRISDLLRLRWSDVYDDEKQDFRTHVSLMEKKTGKPKTIPLGSQAIGALRQLYSHRRGDFIFANNRREAGAISRVQAWRIIHAAVMELGISGKVACHSLRKTWGYHACMDNKLSPALIMLVYNHSSFKITERYLGIEQDHIDQAYLEVELF